MVRPTPYYSVNNLEFDIYKYKCIISNKLVIDIQALVEKDVYIDIFILKKQKYYVFTKNDNLQLN